jgi:hypothetical protein
MSSMSTLGSNSWKWPLIIMVSGWCYATSEDGVHSHMDHDKKWPSTIIMTMFTTKVVNVDGADMRLLLSIIVSHSTCHCHLFWYVVA